MKSLQGTLVAAHAGETRPVTVGSVVFGGPLPAVIAGPCSVESREQVLEAARAVRAAGAVALRGGAYKPRTSPHSFQGLGEEGLKILAAARAETGLPVVTEVMEPADIPLVSEYADMLQIGARNMQNFPLLRAAGRTNRAVLLKRGMSATVEEWLLAAEYVLDAGNPNVVLCERGIRTFETYTRNTLDVAAIAAARRLTHLPVIADPSHAAGRSDLVPDLARAALAVGAHGLIVEVHPDPAHALSDGAQSQDPAEFAAMMRSLGLAPRARRAGGLAQAASR